ITLLFTFSRWNIIVALVSLILFIYQIYSKSNGKLRITIFKKIILALLILGIIVSVLFDIEKVKFLIGTENAILDRTSSLYYRTKALSEAFSYFCERPFLGFGPGEIYVRLISKDSTNPYSTYLEVPHSTFITVLAEGGILTFLTFILLLSSLIRIQKRNVTLKSNESANYQIIGIGLFVSSFAFILSMLFCNFDNIVETSILFWFIQGLGLSFYKLHRMRSRNILSLERNRIIELPPKK
ncbi:MAG: O-antigen ligase family protein, partial [Candidatus Helarchaeota archaeon]